MPEYKTPDGIPVIIDRVDLTQLELGYNVVLPEVGVVLVPSNEIRRTGHMARTRAGGRHKKGEGK